MVALLGLNAVLPGQVCKLQRALYGLKHASTEWFAKLSSFLLSAGYTQSMHDYSLFTKSSNDSFRAILVFIDDITLTGNNDQEIALIKQGLDVFVHIKDLGEFQCFLGFEVARTRKGILMNPAFWDAK